MGTPFPIFGSKTYEYNQNKVKNKAKKLFSKNVTHQFFQKTSFVQLYALFFNFTDVAKEFKKKFKFKLFWTKNCNK